MADYAAELYRNPNAVLLRSGDLKSIVDEFKMLNPSARNQHFIRYRGVTYWAEQVDKLQVE